MADFREPPPLFGDEESGSKVEDKDDLFPPTKEDLPAETNHTEDNPTADDQEKPDDDDEDIFAEADTEIPLSDEEDIDKAIPTVNHHESSKVTPPPEVGVTESTTVSKQPSAPSSKTNESDPASATGGFESLSNVKSKEEEEEEDSGDQFNMEITVTDPKKVGDGMGAYMTYRVCTKTSLPAYRNTEMAVYRRFSDFLGLHGKLVEKHQQNGVVVPPPPEKSVVGMTKIKMSKEDQSSVGFVEKRRACLERFINRTARHPSLKADSLLVEFLSHDGDLPRSTNTSALSGAGVMRLFNRVGDSIGKIAFKMDETDQLELIRNYFCLLPSDDLSQWTDEFEWFEEKHTQIDNLDQQLRKLHSSIESLVAHRKELAVNTCQVSKAVALLGSAEEHTALSRALAQLAEVEERLDQLHQDQADTDFYVLSELVKDYIGIIGAVKDVFAERVKLFKHWKDAEATLTKKRENKVKLELARKTDKLSQADQEIAEWDHKVDQSQADFEKISKNIRKEMGRFERQRVRDFKTTVIHYLESLMNSQQQVIKYWETFLPEAKAIA